MHLVKKGADMIAKFAKILVGIVVALIGIPVLGAFVIGVMAGGGDSFDSSRDGYFEGDVFVNVPVKWRCLVMMNTKCASEGSCQEIVSAIENSSFS